MYIETNQHRIQPVHDSTTVMIPITTQYISHGVSCDGSFALRALYDANTGKRKVATELFTETSVKVGTLRGRVMSVFYYKRDNTHESSFDRRPNMILD